MRWGLASGQSSAHRCGSRLGSADGMVTAETAVVLPALVALLALLLAVVGHALDHAQIVDAARSGARLAARGEPSTAVERAVLAEAPDGSQVRIEMTESTVRVSVLAPARRLLGAVTLPPPHAQSVAVVEGGDWP